MASSPARRRLVASTLAAVLVAGFCTAPPAPLAQAAPAKGIDIELPPVSAAHPAPERQSRPASTTGLADDGVAKAYQQWRKGTYKPQKGQRKDALRVQIEHSKGTSAATLARKLGATNVNEVTSTVLVADVPFDKLKTLQDAAPIDSVQVPPVVNVLPGKVSGTTLASSSSSGSRGGEILSKTNAAAWQALGTTGAGVKIGVIDFFDSGIWNAASSAGEVKPTNQLGGTFCQKNGTGCNIWADGSEHGVAVAEILNDMAPGATLYLASAETLEDTKAAINYFAARGVKIVTRSLTASYDSPGDGTGPSDELVDYAVSKGMAWFNAAGNAGRSLVRANVNGVPRNIYAGGYWRGEWKDTNDNGWIEFSAPGETDSEYMAVDCGFFNGLRWNDWGEDNKTDYTLVASVLDRQTQTLVPVATSDSNQSTGGAPPLEGTDDSSIPGQTSFSDIQCSTQNPVYYVSIFQQSSGASEASPDILEILVNSANLYIYPTDAGSAAQPFVDSKNTGMAAVGAVDPVAGTAAASYSSKGPTNDGRIKPDISAGSGFSSYTYRYDGGFHGTSASSPAAAGAAALILQRNPALKPADLIAYVRRSAIVDRGATGPDNVFGAGELRLADQQFAAATGRPTISGYPKVGVTMTAHAPTGWRPSADSFSYQWFANGVAIPGATRATFVPGGAQYGRTITVRSTGKRQGFITPAATASVPTRAVVAGTLVAPKPKITGNLAVGQTVTAVPWTWTKGTKLTYQWYANGKAISGARSRTLKLTKAQKDKTLSVKVTGSQTGYSTASKTSSATKKLLTAAVPKISGTKKAGSTLKLSRGTWTGKVKFSYRWYRNGKSISGATGTKYKLKKSDKGAKITVKVTGKRSGYATVTLTSKATPKIK